MRALMSLVCGVLGLAAFDAGTNTSRAIVVSGYVRPGMKIPLPIPENHEVGQG